MKYNYSISTTIQFSLMPYKYDLPIFIYLWNSGGKCLDLNYPLGVLEFLHKWADRLEGCSCQKQCSPLCPSNGSISHAHVFDFRRHLNLIEKE